MELRPNPIRVVFHAVIIGTVSIMCLAFLAGLLSRVLFHYGEAASSLLPKDRWMFLMVTGGTLTFVLPITAYAAIFSLSNVAFLLKLRQSTMVLRPDLILQSRGRVIM